MTTTKNTQQKGRYGLLTMLSMVVGMVIGSGIYVKNQSLFNTTQSSILSLGVWVFMTVIVLFMVWCFVEVASSTKISGKQGTMTNWGRDFIGPKTGKAIGIFVTFLYIPTCIAGLSMYMSEAALDTTAYESLLNMGSWMYYAITVAVALAFILIIFAINALTSKPGKIFQISGTGIKLIPIALVISVVFIYTIMVSVGAPTTAGDAFTSSNIYAVFNPADTTLNPSFTNDDSGSLVMLFIVAMPSVMFAYDGFIYAASLQNEAKSKSTFKTSLVGGILFVALVYLWVSWSVFTVAPTDANGNLVLTVPATIEVLFPNATWLPIFVSLCIMISIMTGISGWTITGSRNIAALSEENIVYDPNGTMLARNKSGTPQNSAFILLGATLVWFGVMVSLDAVGLHYTIIQTLINGGTVDGLVKSNLVATNTTLDFVTIGAYTIYCMLIMGAFFNRKTNKVQVEKVKFFKPFALIAATIIGLVTILYTYQVIVPSHIAGIINVDTLLKDWVNYGIKVGILLGLLITFFVGWAYTTKTFEKANSKGMENKNKLIDKYLTGESWISQDQKATLWLGSTWTFSRLKPAKNSRTWAKQEASKTAEQIMNQAAIKQGSWDEYQLKQLAKEGNLNKLNEIHSKTVESMLKVDKLTNEVKLEETKTSEKSKLIKANKTYETTKKYTKK